MEHARRLLQPGTEAPPFNLPVTSNQKLMLDEFRGVPVVLVFYPADWSPVCGAELSLFNELLPEFRRYNAHVFGISVDGTWCHNAYAEERRLHFPLLADFHPRGEVARRYKVYRERDGFSERALYVVDEAGRISWSYLSPIAVNPGADGVLDALERMHPGRASHP